MTQDEIIEMAKQSGMFEITKDGYEVFYPDNLEAFTKLVAAKVEARYMQLFLDPENQPTQFGTATQEYREQEIAKVRDLLFALADRIRTTHLYGPEVKKMLEQEQTIRARGEA